MNENCYQFCEEKANHYERLPKSSHEALQQYRENCNAMRLPLIRAITLRIGHRNAPNFATDYLESMQDSKIPTSGLWCEENLDKAGHQRLSPDGLKPGIQSSIQAMRPFTNGSIVMNADGSHCLCSHTVNGYRGGIPTTIENSMFPRGYLSKNGQNRSWHDAVSVIGRPTP